jgi:hypothetical protein
MNHLPLRILRCPQCTAALDWSPDHDRVVCRRLTPLGVQVVQTDGAFCPREAARLLRPGGALLTIQGRTEWRGETLTDALEGTPPEWTLPGQGWEVGESFRQAGLRISSWTERSATTTYHDIGAVVYTLLHLPWAIVDFDLERYRQRLYRLHRRIQAEGGFVSRGAAYLIEARKP